MCDKSIAHFNSRSSVCQLWDNPKGLLSCSLIYAEDDRLVRRCNDNLGNDQIRQSPESVSINIFTDVEVDIQKYQLFMCVLNVVYIAKLPLCTMNEGKGGLERTGLDPRRYMLLDHTLGSDYRG